MQQTFKWLDPETKEHNDEVTDFDKWRDAGDGIMWPSRSSAIETAIRFTKCSPVRSRSTRNCRANIFDLPKGAQILKKMN